MKHQKTGRILGRVRRQRTALKKTLAGSLILHEGIVTTEAKAKEMRPIMDKLIAKAKRSAESVNLKMVTLRDLQKSMPIIAARKLCSEEMLKRFSERNSGYIRITKLGARKSDSARMAKIEFVD